MDDTLKIQAMLDSENRDIFLPGGVYEISDTLIIHSNTVLRLAENAVIRLADNAGCFMITNDLCEQEGCNQNITIEGGIWDGNNENQSARGKQEDGKPDFYGHNMRFNGVENLTPKNLTYIQ